ncbi:penicillin-binding protein activator [Polymorphobacter sp.]|uniref:penicillin-binding protein activator n=1 Tax=Polymorphobacter sp. TaxID=1909290 RepID=UPI003F6F2480
MRILKRYRQPKQALRAFAIGLGLLVTACAAPQRQVVAPPPPPPPPTAEAPPPVPEARQNRVALLVPMSGANAPVGQSIANAASLALLDLGNSNINLRIYDTAPGAAAAASRALGEGAGLILGPLLASDVRAVSALADSRQVPLISFSNDTAVAGRNVFILGFQASQSISRVVSYARSRGVERFAALVPAGVYGQRAQTAFVQSVDAVNGNTTAIATYSREAARMGAAVRTVTAFDDRSRSSRGGATVRPDGSIATSAARLAPPPFQALLIADSGANAAQFLPALSRFGAPPGSITLLGTELWNNEPGLANAAAMRGALFATVPDGNFRTLSTRYRQRHGNTPSRLASLGYDAVLLVNSLAGSWQVGDPFPTNALRSRQGFSGIDGAFRFDASNIAQRALEVKQVAEGRFTVVSQAPNGFGN